MRAFVRLAQGIPLNPSPRSIPWPALCAMVLWGASFVAVAEALKNFPPFTLVALRLVLGSLLLLLVLALRGRGFLPSRADLVRCVLLGLLLGAHVAIQAHGLVYTSASHSGWIVAFTSVAIALGAHLSGKERLARGGWWGVCAAFLGVWFVTFEDVRALDRSEVGDWIQFSSCFTWATYTLLGADVVARNGALRVTTFAMTVAAAVFIPIALLQSPASPEIEPRSIVAVVFLGIFASGIGSTLWFHSLDRFGSQRSAVVLYLQPFVTLLLAAAILHEPVKAVAFLGGGLVLLGVFLVTRSRVAR